MADDDITQQQSDRVSEKERPLERTSERVAQEATDSLDDLLKLKKDALADQKDPDRLADPKRAKFASLMLGRPEIFDPDANDGQPVVKGMDAGAKGATATAYSYVDVRQQSYTVEKGDNLTKIARQQLGAAASAQDVRGYINEVARLNNIKDPNLIVVGQELKLPDKAQPGAGRDSGGPQPDVYKGGDAQAEEVKGEKAPTNEKEFLDRHPDLARAPEEIKSDYQAVKQERDGKIDYANKLIQKSNDLTREQFKTLGLTDEDARKPGVVEARLKEIQQSNNPNDREKSERVLKLQDQIDGNSDKVRQLGVEIKESEREIRNLHKELKLAENLKALPPKEKEQILQQFNRILTEGDKGNPTLEQRQEIVRDLAHQIANPQDIKQGQKETCGPAGDEATVARNHPTAYAEAVANWALKGEHQGIRLPDGTVQNGDGNPDRSLASKVFQSAAANFAASRRGGEYVNEPAGSQGSGEYLVKRDPDGHIVSKERWEGTNQKDDVALLNKLSGGDNYTNTELRPAPRDAGTFKEGLGKQLENGPVEVSIVKKGEDGRYEPHSVRLTKDSFYEDPPNSGKVMVRYEDPAETYGKTNAVPLQDFYAMALKGRLETRNGVLTPTGQNAWDDVYVSTIQRKSATGSSEASAPREPITKPSARISRTTS